MSFRTALALAAILTLGAAPAFADSVDGKPLDRIARKAPASERGSPSILFEGRGGPLDGCMSEDGYSDGRLCGLGDGF